MANEEKLQDRIKKYFEEKYYGICYHLSPPEHPGFPDLMVCTLFATELVEVKDFTGLSINSKIKNHFTKFQIPWITRHLKKASHVQLAFTYQKIDYIFTIGSIEESIFLTVCTVGELIEKSRVMKWQL